MVKNRNQRSALTRLRISAHHLNIELGRRAGLSVENRQCGYCDSGSTDDELHFILLCQTFHRKRQTFLSKLRSVGVSFQDATSDTLLMSKILCPVSPQAVKLVNNYIKTLENDRVLFDNGLLDLDADWNPQEEPQNNSQVDMSELSDHLDSDSESENSEDEEDVEQVSVDL